MTTEKTALIETAARSALTVLLRVVGYTAFGVALGLGLVLGLIPELRSLGSLQGIPASRVPIGAILALPALIAENWEVFLILAAFAVAFPFGWFLVGKRSGVRRIVHRFVAEHRAVAAGLVTDGLFAGLKLAAGAAPRLDAERVGAFLAGPLPRAVETMRGAPRVVRLAARLLLGRVGELPGVRQALAAAQDPSLDLDSARRRTAEALQAALDPRDFAPSARPALALLAAELALFVAIKLLV